MPTLDINMEALSIQLYNTFSPQTSIPLFINSLDGEEKTNFLLIKELPSRIMMRKIAWLKRVCKV
jgi:hypothetical protein